MRTMMVEVPYQIRSPSFVFDLSRVTLHVLLLTCELSWRIFETTMPEMKDKIKRMILRQDGMGVAFDMLVQCIVMRVIMMQKSNDECQSICCSISEMTPFMLHFMQTIGVCGGSAEELDVSRYSFRPHHAAAAH